MSKLSWIIFSTITVAILAGLVIFSKDTSLKLDKVDVNAVQMADSQNGEIADHVFGKADSKVILIEYGDYQCPPCGTIYPRVKTISKEYKNQIQFIFRNFPIADAHPNARASAAAAEAAGLQGKFWEMHDKIYEGQSDWSSLSGTERSDYYIGLAKDLSLDIEKFKTDIASPNVVAKIDYDYAVGRKANVQGTPSFYLNGKPLDQSIFGDNQKFKDAIDSELKKAGIALPN